MADTKTIIETVFQARHKPRLARFLAADDGGDGIDVRELADQVVKGFPYPVGVELRRLFSSEHHRADRGRLDQILKTLERTLQFTAFVMLSQLLEDGQGPAAGLPESLCERLLKPGGLTMGDSAFLINAAGDCFRTGGMVPFMPEMAAVLNKAFYAKLHFWTPERNEIGHYLINLDDGETERRCFEYSERLAVILSDLAFLIKKDLFLFSRRDRDGWLRYLGTTVTEQCDLRHLSCYGRLQAELGEFGKDAGLVEAIGAPVAGAGQ